VTSKEPTSAVDLYWLPLGAGGHSVRLNGRIFEWFASRLQHRDRRDLYHSALEVYGRDGRFVIELAPASGMDAERGVVAEGAVGSRAAGRFRFFRYEIRCWRDGVIPDVAEAVESPQRLSDDAEHAERLLELVPQVPTPVWGRDELQTGEMWNSNSLISWLIVRDAGGELRLPRARARARELFRVDQQPGRARPGPDPRIAFRGVGVGHASFSRVRARAREDESDSRSTPTQEQAPPA
jgi:hypothetical protein